MTKRVVIGFGNLLMGDDAVGIHVIKHLAAMELPPDVELIDGGVASFEVITDVKNAAEIIIVDALAAGGAAGDIYCVRPHELGEMERGENFSLHQFSLLHSLHLAQQISLLPPVLIYGIEPALIDFTLDMTPAVNSAAEQTAQHIAEYLRGDSHA